MLLDENLGLIEDAVHSVLIGHIVTGEKATKEGTHPSLHPHLATIFYVI